MSDKINLCASADGIVETVATFSFSEKSSFFSLVQILTNTIIREEEIITNAKHLIQQISTTNNY